MKTARQVYDEGKMTELTPSHVIEVIQRLYDLNLAEVFFIGMGWIEGYHYCSNPAYLRKSFAPTALKRYGRQIWFACKYLDK